jgi:hypothetical protein
MSLRKSVIVLKGSKALPARPSDKAKWVQSVREETVVSSGPVCKAKEEVAVFCSVYKKMKLPYIHFYTSGVG